MGLQLGTGLLDLVILRYKVDPAENQEKSEAPFLEALQQAMTYLASKFLRRSPASVCLRFRS